jgi:hypothetical protein
MSRAFESAARKPGRRPRGSGDEPFALVELGKRFARFRKEHSRGTRIPDELREAALVLLREVGPADLYRSCGISSGQVMAWKEARAQRPKSPDVRVFSVVDEEAVQRSEPAAPATPPELELRIGPWSVSVRLGSLPAGRG